MVKTYNPQKILEAIELMRAQLTVVEVTMERATGHNGCFADDTPEPVQQYVNEADRAFSAARRAMRSVSYAVRRWEFIQRTGEEF